MEFLKVSAGGLPIRDQIEGLGRILFRTIRQIHRATVSSANEALDIIIDAGIVDCDDIISSIRSSTALRHSEKLISFHAHRSWLLSIGPPILPILIRVADPNSMLAEAVGLGGHQVPLVESRFAKAIISCRTFSRFIFENAFISSDPSRRAGVLIHQIARRCIEAIPPQSPGKRSLDFVPVSFWAISIQNSAAISFAGPSSGLVVGAVTKSGDQSAGVGFSEPCTRLTPSRPVEHCRCHVDVMPPIRP
jgi:hypothetical protein